MKEARGNPDYNANREALVYSSSRIAHSLYQSIAISRKSTSIRFTFWKLARRPLWIFLQISFLRSARSELVRPTSEAVEAADWCKMRGPGEILKCCQNWGSYRHGIVIALPKHPTSHCLHTLDKHCLNMTSSELFSLNLQVPRQPASVSR